MYKVKTISLFISPDLLRKFILNKKFEQDEIIFDPSQMDGVTDIRFDMPWTKKRVESLLRGGVIYYKTDELNIRWELVNCTLEDKIRLIHIIDQHLLVKTND